MSYHIPSKQHNKQQSLFWSLLCVASQVPANGTIKIRLEANSYIDADVSAAHINITWTTPKTSGWMEAVTDDKGVASARLNMGLLPKVNATKSGDVISLNALWVGPTRERIVATATVR